MTAFFKRSFFTITGLMLMLLISACGGASTTTASGGSTPTTAPSTPSPTAASNYTILTAQATVGGKTETILTDTKGFTLYYFTPDTPTKLACTGGCAKAWPPLVAPDSGTPTSSTSLPGPLTVLKGANGTQVEYSGYLLYTYIKDNAAGQTTGQGVGGVWYVATPNLSSYVIRTAKATVGGKKEAILTNAEGLALYYFTPDTATKIACLAGCAKAWPPLFATGTETPLADIPLKGTLSIITSANGSQVEYNGHALYTYIKDTVDTITGQGLGGKWYIATPTLAAA